MTPKWLTAVLYQAGLLQQGAVHDVEIEASDAFNSQLHYLHLHYSADAAPILPTRLVLKQNIADAWAMAAGGDEVRFYQRVASLPDYPPIMVPCLAAAYDENSGQSYLLLQDVSATHCPPVTRKQQIHGVEGVPTRAALEAVVDTLAQLHAYWWDHPLRETQTFEVGYWSRNAERFRLYLERRTGSWETLLQREGSWLPYDIRTLYEASFAALPRYWERYLAPRFQAGVNLTLIHGDCYFANFLWPRQAGTAATYLIDWQSPGFDIGSYDLVNLCATFWTPTQRHEHNREQTMLRRYHATLQHHGIQQYAWDDLLRDYQAGLIFWLLMPVQDYADGADKDYWWPKMQCLVAAFRDWGCDAVFR